MMPRFCLIIALALLATGCDMPDRISKLEKQNQELQAQLKSRQKQQSVNLESQAKCAKDARDYFHINWETRDPATKQQGYTNHYNKSSNKCFILIHYSDWTNKALQDYDENYILEDVYEKTRHGVFIQNMKNFVLTNI